MSIDSSSQFCECSSVSLLTGIRFKPLLFSLDCLVKKGRYHLVSPLFSTSEAERSTTVTVLMRFFSSRKQPGHIKPIILVPFADEISFFVFFSCVSFLPHHLFIWFHCCCLPLFPFSSFSPTHSPFSIGDC